MSSFNISQYLTDHNLSIEKFQSEIEEAKKLIAINHMRPAVLACKTLCNENRFLVRFCHENACVGDQEHVDHGVGIGKNKDGTVLYIVE